MSVLTKMLKQYAVYWAPTGTDANGQPTWGEPVEIRCRWENAVDLKSVPEAERQDLNAMVYVDRDVLCNGVLLQGELTSSVDEDDPKANAGAGEIRKFTKLPDFKCRKFLRTAYLARG